MFDVEFEEGSVGVSPASWFVTVSAAGEEG
jgi:hypothetical protein